MKKKYVKELDENRDTTHDFTKDATPHKLDELNNSLPMTWQEMKDFCNNLSEEQLIKDVWAWGDELAKPCYRIQEITQDLINPSGEGVEPISVYIGENKESDDADEDFENEPVIIEKGEFRICID